MDDSGVKEIRQILRRIQDHLFQAHSALGVEHETVGFVDVIHHPTNRVADLNYVTPRRNTAWVSGKYVQEGLNRLRELERVQRVQYIEGLYPPLFAKALRDLGLESERETAIMAFSIESMETTVPRTSSPGGIRLELVSDQRGVDQWRTVWRNPAYDVLTLGVEPVAVSGDLTPARLAQEADILLLRDSTPIGLVRVGIQPATRSAHIVALALLHEARTPRLTKLLMTAAMRAGVSRGCTLIFAPGESEADRDFNRKLGFIDVGTMVCYAAHVESVSKNEAPAHDSLLQPVLALRR